MDTSSTFLFLPMSFPERLAALRKERAFTQQQMADKIGMHVSQLKRYEAGASQPTIDVFRRIAVALNVSADMLLFEEGERGPDDQLRLQFEAVSNLDEHEREAVQTMIAGVLHMHDAKRWQQSATRAAAASTRAQATASAAKTAPAAPSTAPGSAAKKRSAPAKPAKRSTLAAAAR
jgi:transcriptional regulator with XRE-family HTH domain